MAGREALVERERELARIGAVVTSASAGVGAALVIEGEAGIGKTALLRAAREHAFATGVSTRHGCGAELESGFPFGVVRQCFEPLILAADQAERERLFSGAAALAKPVVTDAPGIENEASFGALHGLYWLLANLTEKRPLLLIIDDAHWADEPSLRFVAHLARRIDSLPVALVVATRPLDQDGAQASLITGLAGGSPESRVELSALSEAAVGQLIGEAGDETFARACHHATSGNPFLLAELTRALAEEGVPFTAAGAERVQTVAPPQVARLTRLRLARLAPEVSALARAVAMLGDNAPLEVACELAGLDAGDGARGAEALMHAGILEFDRTPRFRHPLLGAAVAAGVTPFERAAAHRKAADLLRERGAQPEQIARHILAATPVSESQDAKILREAAERAIQRGAPPAAVPLLRRTLEERLPADTRVEVLLELGAAERIAGQHANAAEHLREAARLAHDPLAHARALVALGRTIGPDPEGNNQLAPLLAPVLDGVDAFDRELALAIKAAFVSAAFHAGWRDEPRAEAIAAEIARLPGDTPGESIAISALVEPLDRFSDGGKLGSLAERAARNADELLRAGVRDARAHSLLVALRWTDRVAASERLTERWFQIARRQGSEEAFGAASTHSSNLSRMCGRLRQSEADAAAAVAAVGPAAGVSFVMASVTLVDSLLSQGKLDAAEAAYDAIGFGEQIPPLRPYLGVLGTRAELRGARAEHAAALADYDEIDRRRAGPAIGAPGAHLLQAIQCRYALGDRDLLSAELERALAVARQWGTDSVIGAALRVRGRLAGDADQAANDLVAAIEHLERSPRRLEHARALIDLGAVLRRAGHRLDSREPLRAGYELARECGADGLADTARRELAASGVRIRRERLTGIESLTASERRIAELAAQGASNAEIAQALFVTIKTIEMHLTHTYRKLDVRSRGELSTILIASRAV